MIHQVPGDPGDLHPFHRRQLSQLDNALLGWNEVTCSIQKMLRDETETCWMVLKTWF
jgi:hypothetical protein